MSPLCHEINHFLRRTGMPATKFGRLAAKDPRLVHDLRRGRQARDTMADRVRMFMAQAGR